MRVTSSPPDDKVVIPATAVWPSIPLETDGKGPHTWRWEINWRAFHANGEARTQDNHWDALSVINNMGGTLKVTATADSGVASVTITLTGANPMSTDVQSYLAQQANSNGFFSIINHETRCRHFQSNGEPIHSFDNGYGICQLTSPAPTYEQVWSWKENILAGLTLFRRKAAAARRYLGQSDRNFSTDQLRRETVARWNGGAYHSWNTPDGWVRNPDIICDTQTGNIGWDMTDPANAGQTEEQLRQRDRNTYRRGRRAGDNWRYMGVCYADRILGG